ncbi:endoribonuclease Dcr-1 [Contarinia nasturtii]|uniref:endoribonuclease Dcr-1 n=1 Tax=Contarinia nasturtii TaxID=265458 RepID=UPI0012D39924|nr:endoribonuclease Dcr-1 [Contarinia nasturtii]
MATFHWQDNLSSTAFTPRDFQVELLAAASERNIIICLGHNSSKEFIALKLILEKAHELRGHHNGIKKVTLVLTSTSSGGESIYNLIYHLTDLKVLNVNTILKEQLNWKEYLRDFQVIILDIPKCLDAVRNGAINIIQNINLIVIEDCHKNYNNVQLLLLLEYVRNDKKMPKILGLAGPLHSAGCSTDQLPFHLEVLEKTIQCKAETASDIVTVLRYCTKPTELLIQCLPPQNMSNCDVSATLRDIILTKKQFLLEHRYDPLEIYSDEFEDELKHIPDPKKEPIECLDQFLDVLNEFGPWCADRAAIYLIAKIEKLKIKTPYERHYLLLCLVSTTLIQIRAFCETIFERIPSTKECLETYSSPKSLRLLEILRQFKSEKPPEEQNGVKAKVNAINTEKNTTKVNSVENELIKTSGETANDEIKNGIGQSSESKNEKIAVEESSTQPITTRTYVPHRRPRGSNFVRLRRIINYQYDPNALCGLLLCNSMFTAKILFSFISEISRNDPDLEYLSVQYTGDRVADPITETKQFENEHRRQEEVLKRFRMHTCNLLIGTSVLEEGIELPRCNLVIRWNLPTTYRSYVQCKGRARAQKAFHIIMVSTSTISHQNNCNEFVSSKNHRALCMPNDDELKPAKCYDTGELRRALDENMDETKDDEVDTKSVSKCFDAMQNETENFVKLLAQYRQIEQILLKNCSNREPSLKELADADLYTNLIKPYKPIQGDDTPFVNLANAVVLVNKYCAKLPSDTFTKLTPLWRCCKTYRGNREYYQYTVRLPINSPVKQDIYGLPMPSKVLARRMAALICCRILHQSGEFDDFLQPIGKEGFRASEPEWNNFDLEKEDADIVSENLDPRPGTTRRRQYYYKRIASALSNCRPVVGVECKLYFIKMVLECPIPEEQNTRGRQIYAPEDAVQGFGLLTLKHIPKLGSFSIFTRSGEVRVSLELATNNVIIDEYKLTKINVFLKYLFANVLRLQKYLMFFDANATENSFFIVPTIRDANNTVGVDWSFLELIANKSDQMPREVPELSRKSQKFDREKFCDAVVMPWYRNQDQPQYFYVAEICDYLSPESSFPGDSYDTFKEYYFRKYDIVIQNCAQPLLDVDHTSARLNFLTPRYVNRKGVALPTSSEETKRAKRENLEQKQILVPELCTIHPFPASLWRIAVCLPCVLYRINALLLADEIRIEVAEDISLGKSCIVDEEFDWPVLDFGWKLVDVLRRARDNSKTKEMKKTIDGMKNRSESLCEGKTEDKAEILDTKKDIDIDLLKDVEKKLEDECVMEIGTWSNAMAENIDINSSGDEWNDMLPPNISICSRNKLNTRYGSPTSWELPKSKQTIKTIGSESDLSYSDQSDDEFFYQSDDSDTDDDNEGLNIEFKSDNLAEAIETEEDILRRQRKIEIINGINANEKSYQSTKNIGSGYDCSINTNDLQIRASMKWHQSEFRQSVGEFEEKIRASGTLIKYNEQIVILRDPPSSLVKDDSANDFKRLEFLFSFIEPSVLKKFIEDSCDIDETGAIRLSIDDVYNLHKIYFDRYPIERYKVEGVGSVFDAFYDQNSIQIEGDGTITYNLHRDEFVKDRTITRAKITEATEICNVPDIEAVDGEESFSFDRQPNLNENHGPSPSIILQALTMSNANDGINLERLETIGDSFLKYAITTYLYCTYENVHEGKLSHLRSRQVSNLNLYRLGRRKMLGERMIATKFEPHDNWLPPCYYVPKDLEKALIEAKIPACYWEDARLLDVKELSVDEICQVLKKRIFGNSEGSDNENDKDCQTITDNESGSYDDASDSESDENSFAINRDEFPCFIPYNLVTQHSIPDKSIADCVEALIGANLIECGPRGALLFMAWLGIRVLPSKEVIFDDKNTNSIPGSTKPFERDGVKYQTVYGYWAAPKSPLLHFSPNPYESLDLLLDGYSDFEAHLGYFFKDRSYLLQAMTHASYSQNRLTDCYQRLEFLGDAVLDYLITRHLYEDPRQHSPGALTDLRSALVNNTIFASLAVRHGFHKYFKHLSPGLNDVIDRFVRIQVENDHSISEEFYLISEEECDEAEDVEVPKALGDIFESVAGAIFLDSNMSLDMVWKIYSNMMQPEIDQFSNSVPKSPIRELLELEPETAKFGKPEKLADGRRVRVTVDVFGKGTYRGIGRNYRIAKCTAAKCALRQLKKQGLINKKK